MTNLTNAEPGNRKNITGLNPSQFLIEDAALVMFKVVADEVC